MAANAITIPGAEEIEFYFSNGTYADAQAMPILKAKISNELGKLFVKDGVGNLRKILFDASGSSNTPSGRIFISDSDGAAASDSTFKYAGGKLSISAPAAAAAGLAVIYRSGGLETRTMEQLRGDIGAQAAITGGATSITADNLSVSRTLVSDASGKVAASSVTSAELAHLSGVTSGIQAQINTKQNKDNDLIAIAGLSSTGFAVRTATDTWAQRAIAVSGNGISVSNGNGVSGNPT